MNYLLKTKPLTTPYILILPAHCPLTNRFGFLGKFGYSLTIGIVLIIFSLQIVFSKWQLKTYKSGAMEWIWRHLTYG
ncbi:DUF418 domain-containing protein [Zobellia uliginosa]|uniref:DUF418 domain-containing protein n=1 Tax=Zobellia uliginosa TaxID=143224 RepID=UPI00349F93B8